MFAINHAATALILKRWRPELSLVPLLASVQLVELLWVVLNLSGVERTMTEPAVRYVGDIHLAFMPFSHSVASTFAIAGVACLLAATAGKPRLGVVVAVGVVSHLVLDLATHDGDIALAPFVSGPMLGTRLYSRLPAAAFIFEILYGLLCWRIYQGGRVLLTVIVGFNVANASLFFPAIHGPEQWLAGRPIVLALVILLQIAVTIGAVWWAAKRAKA